MALKAVYSSESRDVKAKYNTIIAKLQANVARYKSTFPQLSAIEELLDMTMPETDNGEDYLQRLEELCAYLYQLSVSSYVIRHLHHNLCADVGAARNGTFLFNQDEYYLMLPS